ncbi:metallophosphoesterase [Flavobacterium rhizosphaerae]|uniref:Metallophosphoesterase n=1 Tax=Flavobacterium rhizosphaerae TaxID=3163298 RepID=A0ABW8YRY4_9FLAO
MKVKLILPSYKIMKFFWYGIRLPKNIPLTLFIIAIVTSCATYHPQYGAKAAIPSKDSISVTTQKLDQRFYLIGDAGYASQPNGQRLLEAVAAHLKNEGKNTTLLYMGDNIYPLGMPPEKEDKHRAEAEASLNSQLDMAKVFKGNIYFIPGNHDWYHGLKGVQEEEKLVEKALGKKTFLPGKGCGIDDIKINSDITLITIDSEWYIENWDDYPTMNDDCDIKTRAAFWEELRSLLNKNQDKTVLLAIHHPVMSNGAHGGQLSARKELYPLKYKFPMPVLGSLMNFVRRTSGGSPQDLQSAIYRDMTSHIKTLIQPYDNVLVLSGHDHNLQYIEKDNIHQIISGAGSKEEEARVVGDHDFSYGGRGYAVLDVYKNGNANIKYYRVTDTDEDLVFEKSLLSKPVPLLEEYPVSGFPKDTAATIYTKQETTYSSLYRFLFGNHYRSYYSTSVKAPVAELDTLYGGFTVGRTGGGHQSNSLRLIDKNGHEYVMRALRKSATRFLQTTAFTTSYIGNDYENTFAEHFLLDFYTTAHPYTPFIIGDLSDAVGIYHTNPRLFYVPKQHILGKHNEDYGGALYMIEEHPDDEFSKLDSFGKADGIDGTADVYEKLRKSKTNVIDEQAYIRARLFDLLIGDWDRHGDQWRWSKFKTPDSTYYRPIPRDRDQAFPKHGGALLSLIMKIPPLRYMKPYSDDISSVKWQIKQGYTQDVAFITKSGASVWYKEAAYLQQHLTDAVIDSAFAQLPPEVIDGNTEEIKSDLKSRRDKLLKYIPKYRDVLLKTVVLTGTDDKDRFVITRSPNGNTQVAMYRHKKEGDSLVFSQVYNKKQTKEIWIYGLDDDDVYEVKGKPAGAILLRLIGGQNHDEYIAENARRVKIYDFKSKNNTYKAKGAALKLTDDYETNLYNPKKPDYNIFATYPMAGYNPDDMVKLGVIADYTVNRFIRNPYSQKHTLKANFYFATKGFEFIYRGAFMNVASKWNFALDARYTSPTFSINYFGQGNDTKNNDDDLGMDFNRVKLQVFRLSPSFFKEGRNGSFMELKTDFETIEVDESHNRYVNQPGILQPYLFEHRQFAGINGTYRFENYDNKSLPALGMKFYATGGWKASLDVFERNFAHAETGVTFYHKITRNERLVFGTTFKGKFIFNNNYEFYQAATLGGDNDLRGYRRARFNGRTAFYNSNDVRFTIGKWKSSFIPLTYGILGGYDYGRVWLPSEESDTWHQSVGGGMWLNGADAATAMVSCFYGSEGPRISFQLVIGF